MIKYKTNFPIDSSYYRDMTNSYYNLMPFTNIQYPMPEYNNFTAIDIDDSDEHFEKEMAYLRELHPDICKKIQKYIDSACDKMEYEDSYMFDEFPDKTMLDIITDKIYNEASKSLLMDKMDNLIPADKIEGQLKRPAWFRHLINVMFLNEMYRRRSRRYFDKKRLARYPLEPISRRHYFPFYTGSIKMGEKDFNGYNYWDSF